MFGHASSDPFKLMSQLHGIGHKKAHEQPAIQDLVELSTEDGPLITVPLAELPAVAAKGSWQRLQTFMQERSEVPLKSITCIDGNSQIQTSFSCFFAERDQEWHKLMAAWEHGRPDRIAAKSRELVHKQHTRGPDCSVA